MAIVGAVAWALFSGLTGLATGVVMLCIARSGSAIGKAVIDPTHNSLLADYYPIDSRSRVFSTHRAANAVGSFVGPLSAGLLAYAFGWRTPFLVFVIPTMIFALMALRLREPVRGRWERQAMGASDEVIATEETAPSYAESWRTVQKIESLKRIWWSLPFLATALIGFVTLASLLYEQEFGLDERARGIASAIAEPFQLVGLVLGSRIITRRFLGDMRGLIRFLAKVAVGTSIAAIGFATAPNIVVAVGFNCVISAALAMLGPGILVALSLAIPPRARATGFSVASLWVIPGLIVLPIIGWISGHVGIRWGMLVLVPLFIIGSLILGSAGSVIDADIAQVWRAAAARSEALYQRRQGQSDLLLVRGVDAGYGGRQVLFGVDIDDQGRRDRRAAGYERRGQEHVAEGDQRRGRSRPWRGRARWSRHHARAAQRDRRPRHQSDARRSRRVRIADGHREPAPRGLDATANARCARGHRRGADDVPGPARAPRRIRRPISAAANSRCSRSAWHSSPSRECC